ncbi:GlsB/YeaQ/YmgE family stress response membrane protein [Pseudonocardia nigra]|uniref:GlsB/YeaQ/YmgE family stress response membrane protein n=1 Tax=Pseudonocardia nigra TaxID=1921578 RepID=UPI0027E257E4|nr:GlsB/YeaQ/YmgE family stress response membrane protein [Pseudonocardia nigra]
MGVIWSIIVAIVVGAIIGALGRLLVPGRQNISIALTIAVGIVAALIGTWLANLMGIATATPGIDWGELLVQVVLAAIGVFIVAGVAGRRSLRR